ncbi:MULTISPECIES: hypothetical protein [Acidiplasma]|jgi:hypothetical protein|nr:MULTISPECIES: hypothetical protein [Acidiplasma]KQB36157.1 hypothetical protein AOG54_02350 [Acidiplasma aeolicum]WMT54285.1 MAG: hypothetical protein RE470_05055 [Acidiplasma sp.]
MALNIVYNTINDARYNVINTLSITVNSNIYNAMGLDGVLSPIELSRTFGFNRITGIRHSFDNAYKTIEGIVNKKLKKKYAGKLSISLSEDSNMTNALSYMKQGRIVALFMDYSTFSGNADIPDGIFYSFPAAFISGRFIEINPDISVNDKILDINYYNDKFKNVFKAYSENELREIFIKSRNKMVVYVNINSDSASQLKLLTEYQGDAFEYR